MRNCAAHDQSLKEVSDKHFWGVKGTKGKKMLEESVLRPEEDLRRPF